MPRKFGNEIRLPGTTGIDNLPIPLTMTLSWQTELNYSRYSLSTLCYHWQTIRISFLLEMTIAKDH